MGRQNYRGYGYLFILMLIFGLAGGIIGEILGNSVNTLYFLKRDFVLGISKPLSVDLKLIAITFGILFKVNILSVVGLILGFIIYKKM
ncbi:hypothetical protein ABG79_00308 [Caloramator mitchellensis]|uniref:DUF4321 domain-containing protein n=1 Tax=Caloramator mitchellensis TaxID=908809 RepID=A0A0R3JYJ4_CALMK|nr:DUF4321 domain-containing protein [Caloramator mitchellensis]KRQ88138.1 hypothetical protein ABG79_00308 [Caloramator mitchellensis]